MAKWTLYAAVVITCCFAVPATALAQTDTGESVFRGAGFLRADANCDGRVNISDAIATTRGLFGRSVMCCEAAADADGNSRVNLADVTHVLSYLTISGAPPLGPFPSCGEAPTGNLECAEESCRGMADTFTLFDTTFEADSVVFIVGRWSQDTSAARRRMGQLKEQIADLPEWLPIDIVRYNGDQPVSLSTSASPSIVMANGRDSVNAALDEAFREASSQGDDIGALFATALECARRGTGNQAVIYLGNGWDTSFGEVDFNRVVDGELRARVLRTIMQANTADPVLIHTIGVDRYSPTSRQLIRDIGVRSGGTYTDGGRTINPNVRPGNNNYASC